MAELEAELAAKGLPAPTRKPEMVAAVRAARTDLAAEQLSHAPQSALAPYPPPGVVLPWFSPRKQRGRRGASGVDALQCIQPAFYFPPPYRLPADQKQKRKSAPAGQRKYTASQVDRKLVQLENDEAVSPLKAARPNSADGNDADDDMDVDF